MENAFNARSLNEICEYLYNLTSSFNAFYSNIEVSTEKDLHKKESYLTLTKLVYDINKYLLDILAIKVPNKI
jgi:arginyl-tRNA synthetase